VGVEDGEEDGVGDTLLNIFLFLFRRELSIASMSKLIIQKSKIKVVCC